jgi:hypothetical protein
VRLRALRGRHNIRLALLAVEVEQPVRLAELLLEPHQLRICLRVPLLLRSSRRRARALKLVRLLTHRRFRALGPLAHVPAASIAVLDVALQQALLLQHRL